MIKDSLSQIQDPNYRRDGPTYVYGNGDYTYEVFQDWAQLPPGWCFYNASSVTIDSKDNVYLLDRSRDHPVMVFNHDGEFLNSWGKGLFKQGHFIRIDPKGYLWIADIATHVVTKCTTEGEVLLTLGTRDKPSETGVAPDVDDYRSITHPAGPFNSPTDIAFATSGDVYVSDGYGNSRIHQFSKEGDLLSSWGQPGNGHKQFNLPHSVWIDRQNRLYVIDRENNRIQIFTLEGDFINEWTDFSRPNQIYIDSNNTMFVIECAYSFQTYWRKMKAPSDGILRDPVPRILLRTLENKSVTQWGGQDPAIPGQFFSPHSICTDSKGDLYVVEVLDCNNPPRGSHHLQKFSRR
jgi:DNA-binding beta-propeller fold protein YncE